MTPRCPECGFTFPKPQTCTSPLHSPSPEQRDGRGKLVCSACGESPGNCECEDHDGPKFVTTAQRNALKAQEDAERLGLPELEGRAKEANLENRDPQLRDSPGNLNKPATPPEQQETSERVEREAAWYREQANAEVNPEQGERVEPEQVYIDLDPVGEPFVCDEDGGWPFVPASALAQERERRQRAEKERAQLIRRVRYCDTKAEQVGDPIDSYRIAASPWHKLLALTSPGPHTRTEDEIRTEQAEAEARTERERREEAERQLEVVRRNHGDRVGDWARERQRAEAAEARLASLQERVEELERALRAIADGSWEAELVARYPDAGFRTVSIPQDSSIRVLARSALHTHQEGATPDAKGHHRG